ncbi:uncharacterized protein BJ171DRAFT_175124 [Polychytrium aggregatum]|uniref:uncharacterized protein n=1 Tax=Polychytrium aggregatum TaxID=110093 RepID=UPI0022FF3890|nr:uncharacterized protein BJ171DRAFT_175124 [Polychytrium aggregatum]KAI9209088.1 hypothetical protein BJ171DRAFT_175124 [Polychytrium aggregatum]
MRSVLTPPLLLLKRCSHSQSALGHPSIHPRPSIYPPALAPPAMSSKAPFAAFNTTQSFWLVSSSPTTTAPECLSPSDPPDVRIGKLGDQLTLTNICGSLTSPSISNYYTFWQNAWAFYSCSSQNCDPSSCGTAPVSSVPLNSLLSPCDAGYFRVVNDTNAYAAPFYGRPMPTFAYKTLYTDSTCQTPMSMVRVPLYPTCTPVSSGLYGLSLSISISVNSAVPSMRFVRNYGCVDAQCSQCYSSRQANDVVVSRSCSPASVAGKMWADSNMYPSYVRLGSAFPNGSIPTLEGSLLSPGSTLSPSPTTTASTNAPGDVADPDKGLTIGLSVATVLLVVSVAVLAVWIARVRRRRLSSKPPGVAVPVPKEELAPFAYLHNRAPTPGSVDLVPNRAPTPGSADLLHSPSILYNNYNYNHNHSHNPNYNYNYNYNQQRLSPPPSVLDEPVHRQDSLTRPQPNLAFPSVHQLS